MKGILSPKFLGFVIGERVRFLSYSFCFFVLLFMLNCSVCFGLGIGGGGGLPGGSVSYPYSSCYATYQVLSRYSATWFATNVVSPTNAWFFYDFSTNVYLQDFNDVNVSAYYASYETGLKLSIMYYVDSNNVVWCFVPIGSQGYSSTQIIFYLLSDVSGNILNNQTMTYHGQQLFPITINDVPFYTSKRISTNNVKSPHLDLSIFWGIITLCCFVEVIRWTARKAIKLMVRS